MPPPPPPLRDDAFLRFAHDFAHNTRHTSEEDASVQERHVHDKSSHARQRYVNGAPAIVAAMITVDA